MSFELLSSDNKITAQFYILTIICLNTNYTCDNFAICLQEHYISLVLEQNMNSGPSKKVNSLST